MRDLLEGAFNDHVSVVAASREAVLRDLEAMAGLLIKTVDAGGTIFVAGNGGSAADALHFVAELVGRFEADRAPIRAVALGVDAPTMTAISNDFDFTAVVSRHLEALAVPGDLLLAISTSGTSLNIVRAATRARTLGCAVVALTGEGGGDLADACDVLVAVASANTARVQEVHAICLHAIASALEGSISSGTAPMRRR